MLTFIWVVMALGQVLWALLSWGLYALLTTDPARLGDLGELLERVPFGEGLDRWVPGWQAMAQLAIEAAQWALETVGSIAPIVVGVVWACGALLLLAAAALLSLIVVLLRDPPAPRSPA